MAKTTSNEANKIPVTICAELLVVFWNWCQKKKANPPKSRTKKIFQYQGI